MRIIRLKIKTDVAETLNRFGRLYSIEDPGFVLDLFSLFRLNGGGLPTDDRLDALAQKYADKRGANKTLTLLHMRHRRFTLQEISKNPLFAALVAAESAAPHNAVKRLLQLFRTFTYKRQQAICSTCQFLSTCAFGQQYGEVVRDISKVLDIDASKKLHASCPVKDEIKDLNDVFAQSRNLSSALSLNTTQTKAVSTLTGDKEELEEASEELEEEVKLQSLFDYSEQFLDLEDSALAATPDFGGEAPGKGGISPAGTHAGKHFAKVSETFVARLSTAHLQLFNLGQKLDSLLKSGLEGKFKPTSEVQQDQKQARIKDVSELPNIEPTEHALDDDHLDARVAKQDVTVRQYQEPEAKQQLLYAIIDESASMQGAVAPSSSFGLVTRGQTATTLATALAKRVQDDGGRLLVRFFSDSPGPLNQARRKDEFDSLVDFILKADINGGGTSIIRALRAAHRDISEAQDEIAKAEVLLITDMDDVISKTDESWIKASFSEKGIRLNVLCANATPSYGNAHEVLMRTATKYLQVNPNTLDLDAIVNLVK